MDPIMTLIRFYFGECLDKLSKKGDENSCRLEELIYDYAGYYFSAERAEHSNQTDVQFVSMQLGEITYDNQDNIE